MPPRTRIHSAWVILPPLLCLGVLCSLAALSPRAKAQEPAGSKSGAEAASDRPVKDREASEQSAIPPRTLPALSVDQLRICREQLAAFNPLIGGWRGVGQLMRNSTKGAWSENDEWIWDLGKEHADLICIARGGKQFLAARLSYVPAEKQFLLRLRLPDQSIREYRGTQDKNRLVLESLPDAGAQIHQVIVTQLNAKRMTLFLGIRKTSQETFQRVAEVGYTREGTRLAVEGAGEPECIVTGGKGTMTVTYKGRTYYVCCTGCRDAFNDDPEGILAEAAERAKKKPKE